jgi:hypothetical protein
MPLLTVRSSEALLLDKPVASIEPLGNQITVVGKGVGPTPVNGAEIFDAEGAAGLRLTAIRTAKVNVTYIEDLGPEKLAEIAREAEQETT